MFLECYGLDPYHFFNSPGLGWDAMLKLGGIELKIILNIDIYRFIEKEIRGGISYFAKRYSRTNNKYMRSYDINKPSKFIIGLDAKNLYGWTMSQYFHYGRFKWLSREKIQLM